MRRALLRALSGPAPRLLMGGAWAAAFWMAALPWAWAGELRISAAVDKTTVNVGEPLTLTLTVSGDIAGAKLRPPQWPEGFTVAAQSQQTNFSINAGVTERSTGLVYVLVAQKAGAFKLGPFTVVREQQTLDTEPIDVTVEKSALPPNLQPQGERFTL